MTKSYPKSFYNSLNLKNQHFFSKFAFAKIHLYLKITYQPLAFILQ